MNVILIIKGEAGEGRREFIVTGSFLRLGGGEKPKEQVTPALYTEKWCYVPFGAEGARELYDLEADPYAKADVAGDNSSLVEELHGKFVGWLKEMEAPPEASAPFE